MKSLFAILCLIVFFPLARGQANLVPNPSFENYFRCPEEGPANVSGIGSYIYNWDDVFVSKGWGSDFCYFNSCNHRRSVSVPINGRGFQKAVSGNAYAGLVISHNAGRNYYGIQLIKPMQKGKLYHLTFNINPADSSSYFMNKFGATFYTTKTIIDPGPEIYRWNGRDAVYPNRAHIYTNEILTDTGMWYTIKGDFKADSNYAFLVLGNFWHIDSIAQIKRSNYEPPPYDTITHLAIYFLDDVSLVEIKQLRALAEKICLGDSTQLYAYSVDTGFYWKQHSMQDTILSKADTITVMPTQTTTYYLFAATHELIDSVIIEVFKLPENSILPTDTVLCRTNELQLNAYVAGAKYKWNTNDTTAYITVLNKGKYSVQIGLPKCYITENVEVSICPTTFFLPNVFTPNNDGLNDEFKPVGIRVQDYRLQMYDRWGRLCFESNEFDKGWQGENYAADVYFYLITFTDSDGHLQTNRGTVQLLR